MLVGDGDDEYVTHIHSRRHSSRHAAAAASTHVHQDTSAALRQTDRPTDREREREKANGVRAMVGCASDETGSCYGKLFRVGGGDIKSLLTNEKFISKPIMI